jgi:hypothetical protein
MSVVAFIAIVIATTTSTMSKSSTGMPPLYIHKKEKPKICQKTKKKPPRKAIKARGSEFCNRASRVESTCRISLSEFDGERLALEKQK